MKYIVTRKDAMKLDTKEQRLRDTLGLLIPYTQAELNELEGECGE